MRLQLFSDIHLEFYNSDEIDDVLKSIPIVGDVIILAGDITSSERFDEIFPKVVNYFRDVQTMPIRFTPKPHD